jgi:hypothetical protein
MANTIQMTPVFFFIFGREDPPYKVAWNTHRRCTVLDLTLFSQNAFCLYYIYVILNDTISTSDYTASNCRMASEKQTGRHVEETFHFLLHNTGIFLQKWT